LQKRQAAGLLIITAVLWSFGGLLIKWVDWNPLAIAGTRSAIAAVVILVGLGRPKFCWSGTLLAGSIAYMLTVLLFVVATKWTTAANAILLQYTAPIYVALFSRWFLGESSHWIDWATIALTLGGMGLFFVDSLSFQGMGGNICAILSGISFAWMALLLRKQKDANPLASVLLGNILTALVAIPWYYPIPHQMATWTGLCLLGVFQIGLSYILYSIAIRYVTAIEASLIPIIEPILNPIWVSIFIGETPGRWELIGGLIVLGAMTGRGVIMSAFPHRFQYKR
jgi:drug/metabolite transporter (DMT)-like permease